MISAEYVKGVSKKTGKEYGALDIKITDKYTKRVFLNDSEKALIEILHNNEN